MYLTNGQPFRIAASTASKGNGYYCDPPKKGKVEKVVEVKKTNEFSIAYAVTVLEWCLSSIDVAVRRGLIELFYKAGRPYIRILKV